MKRPFAYIAAILPVLAMLFSCNNESTIGSSIVEDQVNVYIDSAFTVTGYTQKIGKVQSRTINQLLGRIEAKGYGRLASDVVTQFMPALQLDTANITIEGIDSLHLMMYVANDEFVGDSVAPLGLNIYKLNRQLPSPIYSDFNPQDYYSPNDLIASTVYNLSNNTADTIYDSDAINIIVKLPVEFGRDLYREFQRSPSTFASPTAFANFFPGFYIKNSFGSGRITRVTSTMMRMYYHYSEVNSSGNDTTLVKYGNYFAVTPEIITNNNVSMQISPDIESRITNGEQIVMGPVGTEVIMRFPIPEIIAAYKATNNPVKVLNSLTFQVPGESIDNDQSISIPKYLLLVLTKDKESFFASNTLPDNVTSFYATYDSETGLYDFGDMRSYLLDLLDKDSITEEDYTFSLTPVSASFETSSSSSSYYYYYYYGSSTTQTLSMLTPYMAAPVMGKLNLDKAEIKLTFSTQSIAK